MASFSSEVSQGQVTEFINRFGRFGGTKRKFKTLLGDDRLMEEWVQMLNTFQHFQLMSGIFSSPDEQISKVRQWNVRYGWNFTEKDFDSLGAPPEESADDLVAVVLVPYLETVPRTFEELWYAAKYSFENNSRTAQVRSDSEHLALIYGIEHVPGLRWEVIDLGANWDKRIGVSPKEVRNPKDSPHAGVLAAAALHTEWVKRMNGDDIPFVWLPGYEVNIDGYGQWRGVLRLRFYDDPSRIGIRAIDGERRFSRCAVPVFRK